jgi:hypothetical protein
MFIFATVPLPLQLHQNIHTSRPTSAHRTRQQQPAHAESNLRMTLIDQRENAVRLHRIRRRPHSATLSQT